jgi:hypothetical protein
MTRYTGAWARSATQWYEDPDRFTVSGPTDPAHGDKANAPPPLMMDAPTLHDTGDIYTDAIWENYHNLPPSDPIDRTPAEGQGPPGESGHGYGGVFRITATDAELANARGRDLGASRRATQTTPVYKKHDETFFGTHTIGFDPPPITHISNNPGLIRGINGYPANDGSGGRPGSWRVNAPSWRRGDYYQENVQRDFSPPDRRHGQFKMVEVDSVTIIGDQPPPDQWDPYAPPVSSLQRFLPWRRRVRGIRRDPGPWDEDMQALPTTAVGDVSTLPVEYLVVP